MGGTTYSDVMPDGMMDGWDVERLWYLASTMDIRRVRLDKIRDFDMVTWFNPNWPPTCRAVAEHARRIQEVTFEHPVILSSDYYVMDGMHRVCKAYMLGLDDIEAVQFVVNPEPDHRIRPEDLPSAPTHSG